MKVLFVNADQEQSFRASAALSRHACTVDWVRDVLSAQGLVFSQTYDLIVLDLKTLHHSDFEIEDLVLSGQSKLLLLNDAQWMLSDEPSTCPIPKPLTIDELIASVEGVAQ